jgi:hypothetical protein
MAKRPTLTTAAGDPLERLAFLLTSLLPVPLARPAVASQVDPKQTFVWQRGDAKFVPWEGLPPRRLARRGLSQEADRSADSDQARMISVRDGDGPTALRWCAGTLMDGTMQRYQYDLLHGAHRQRPR